MIEVSGYLDEILIDTNYVSLIEDKEAFILSMVDVPIIMNGNVVGVINEVDLESGIWYGVIWNKITPTVTRLGDVTSFNLIDERGE